MGEVAELALEVDQGIYYTLLKICSVFNYPFTWVVVHRGGSGVRQVGVNQAIPLMM